jgi:3-deoxy-7-phosphoheptulonate synthase
MKNPTSGDVSVLMNSITAAQHAHMFLYRGWEVKSSGNPTAHAILRGYVNREGENVANYHREDIERILAEYKARGLENPALIIDCNHSNSGKKYKEQTRIAREVLDMCHDSPDIAGIFKGFMIESYIEEGCQRIGEGIYGKSITDPCLGWKDTEDFIYYMAKRL